MRQRAAESDLVIVNHHLLCADASVRQSTYGEVIPDCHYAVIDEAHQIEDVATQYFGISVSNYRVATGARAERALNSVRSQTTVRRCVRRSRTSTITHTFLERRDGAPLRPRTGSGQGPNLRSGRCSEDRLRTDRMVGDSRSRPGVVASLDTLANRGPPGRHEEPEPR